jgi:hypothetical protein
MNLLAARRGTDGTTEPSTSGEPARELHPAKEFSPLSPAVETRSPFADPSFGEVLSSGRSVPRPPRPVLQEDDGGAVEPELVCTAPLQPSVGPAWLHAEAVGIAWRL